jgi:hypothetical protein
MPLYCAVCDTVRHHRSATSLPRRHPHRFAGRLPPARHTTHRILRRSCDNRRMQRLLSLFLLLLSACGTTAGSPAAEPGPDPAAATAALLPADALPAPYRLLRSAPVWRLYGDAPRSDAAAYWEIVSGGDDRNEVGHLMILPYADAADAERAYAAARVEAEFMKTDIAELDLDVRSSVSGPFGYERSDVVLIECRTVVHLALLGDTLALLEPLAERIYSAIRGGCAPTPAP